MEIKHATFKSGIHPAYNKQFTDHLPIEIMPAPAEVVLPLSMHIGAPCKPIVEVGQTVKMGQLVAEADGFVSANIHASVSGTVKAIENRLTGNGQKSLCIVIENDSQDNLSDEIKPMAWEDLSVEALLECVANAGIVGMGGATFPTRVKLTPPADKKIDHIIINGAECEPYLTSDHAVMREHPDKVIGGLKIMMKILGQTKGYIGIEDNKEDAIQAIQAVADESIEIYSLHTKYPQGSEKQLVTAITGREVPSGALPSEVGCVISNSSTAIAIYDAVTSGMPLIERVVTVTGKGINEHAVLQFRVGTLVSDIIEYCGGLTADTEKVILGGPMMGFAIFDTAVPATKGTSGILCMNTEEAYMLEPSNCIRCGKCTEVCPMGLMPLYIASYSLNGDYDKSDEYNAMDCIECGSCAFICPARRPLVASIRVAKKHIQAKRRKDG